MLVTHYTMQHTYIMCDCRFVTAKVLPVAYGIKKLQISCVIEDDKVGTDFLEESILAFEDLVSAIICSVFSATKLVLTIVMMTGSEC